MKTEIDNSKDYVKELTRVYNRFNKHFWNNELPEVIITIVPTKGSYGHFVGAKVWKDETAEYENWKYEINISSLSIGRPAKEVCETLLHEQVHLYCHINGIDETSNHGKYHNKKFKKVAEEHGYVISEKTDSTIGWSHGEFSESAFYYFKRLNVKQFKLQRIEKKSPSYNPLVKYECPSCGKTKCWCSKEQYLICGICGVDLVPMGTHVRNKKQDD